MGNLSLKSFNPKKDVRILIQGLDSSGKTTILYKLKLDEVVTTVPTIGCVDSEINLGDFSVVGIHECTSLRIGFNVETVEYKGISFTTWDFGGNEKMRPLYRHYYPDAQALIFVVDSNDRERFSEVKEEMQKVLQEDELRDTLILVLANKQDIPGAASVIEIVEAINLYKIKQKCHIIPTVAITGDGLNEGLDWIIKQLTETTPMGKVVAANTEPTHYLSNSWQAVKKIFTT